MLALIPSRDRFSLRFSLPMVDTSQMDRRTLLLLTLPFLLRGAGPITGRWRSVETTKGGIGAVYDFRPDGTASYSSAALVEMDYRLVGNLLTLGEQRAGIGWHPDGRLQLNYGGDQVEDFVRQGKGEAPESLLGEWRGNRVMGGRKVPVTLQFRADGRALLVIELSTQLGRYAGTENGWVLTLPALPRRKVNQDVGAEKIGIQVEGGDRHEFERF